MALIFMACAAKNQGNAEKLPVQEETGYTEIQFHEEIHNFGLLQSGETVIFTFEFINTGEKNLTIEKLETDCACMKADFHPVNVAPGEKGRIEVEFDSSGLFGKQFKSIVIHANTKKPKQLAIFAEVQNKQIEYKY
jgi:hypothetical protein